MNSDLRRLASCSLLLAVLAAGHAHAAEDQLALGVRTTEPLPPAEQQRKFRLPPGFEIQLVAHEPDLHKPMNLAFDAAGRLWVTTSIEYPWAAPTNRPGRDRVMIFEDFGPDGRARKATQFADGLNIPIGVYPFRTDDTHWKAIVWSIPHLWLLEDTDADGKADKRTPLYGPFDHTRDTHGNQASLRRGFDGWLYATHGFNNDSHVTARDGSHVDLNSGNTYRIRLDGSRIEHHTHGQVNPFGLAWDARGNLYSSDCHSAPIYQLLAGGWYPSFGKPHDGLGFAPVMLEHAHGSTAIDGAVYYEDDLWPAEYRDMFLIGNVMTSRLNRDRISFLGSTPKATEQPDFVTSDDPWFRPVDNCLGPDGALYIADFYNRIIGHYEVPLTHPGRDRERGRIWRVVYRGTDGPPRLRNPALAPDLDGLVGELASPNLTRRLGAMAEIQDRFGASALPAIDGLLRQQGYPVRGDSFPKPRFGSAGPARPNAVVAALWLRNRLVKPGSEEGWTQPLQAGHLPENAPVIRAHVQRIYAERGFEGVMPRSDRGFSIWALTKDPDALVRRCAAEALGRWPAQEQVQPLLGALGQADPADTHLVYVLRKALRDHLKVPAIFEQVLARKDWSDADQRAFADVCLAVPTPQAASLLVRQLASLDDRTSPTLSDALKHAARYAPETELTGLAGFVRQRFAGQADFQLALFRSVDQGLQQRGLALPATLQSWGAELVGQLLAGGAASTWNNTPLEAATENPWDYQERKRSDGQTLRVLSSLMRGEQQTGRLRSPAFAAGARVRFWLCGHDGYPDQPAKKLNAVRLRDAASGELLFEAWPPRSDVAVRVEWNTAPLKGRQVVLEATDADTGEAYAWLAIGGLEGAPGLPAQAPRALADRAAGAAELAGRLGLDEAAPRLREIATQPGDPEARAAAARGFARLRPAEAVDVLGPVLARGDEPLPVRERLGVVLAELNTPGGRAAVSAAFRQVPYRTQLRWATALTATREGADTFLQAVEGGLASPRILQTTGARNRLQSANPPGWETRVAKLTRDLPPADEARERLIAARRNAYALADARAAEGQKIYEANCAACHQLDGKGGLVGPQLTGIGNRGAERLCEDILDPNRNVDHAFRQTELTLKDGGTVSGLFRREEGELLVLVNAGGQEMSFRRADVAARRESELSLMPDNFGEAIPADGFPHLLAFLLAQRGK